MTPDEPYITRETLAGAAALAKHPAVSLGDVTFAGAEGWRYTISRSTPRDRWELLQALEEHLLGALPIGRERLRAHGHEHGDADVRPYTYGDQWLARLVDEALALMPTVVRAIAVREAAWLGVGRESNAWTSSALFVSADNRTKSRVVVCGPATTIRTILHEAVHLLFAPELDGKAAVCAAGERELHALAESQGWAERLEDDTAMHELLADVLSLIWMYKAPHGPVS